MTAFTVEELLACSKPSFRRILRDCSVERGPTGALAYRCEELMTRLESLVSGGRVGEREMPHLMTRVELASLCVMVAVELSGLCRTNYGPPRLV